MEDIDSIQIVAGFEIYSDSSLSWSPHGPAWAAEPDEVTLLREQVQALQLRLSPPTVEELQGTISRDNVQRFRSVRDLPGWVPASWL